ncbi:flavonol 3-sulfotransferase-like [Cocos nucifera]|uniref:Sulfotransferase n=1 Tax=Cocos nucifera TaxID=13894 RepID=A0A8K0ITZ8_COCNU|nr:flavonol 3-sulfotransferase-like [Cocos nucifera]
MAAFPSLSHGSHLSEAQEDKREENLTPGQRITEYNDLISTLPHLLRKYHNFWIPEYQLPSIVIIQQHFKARHSDVFLVSHPKSGTTWLKALVFATINRTRYQFDNHPLLSRSPQDGVPCIEYDFAKDEASKIEAMPSPRILQSHYPYSPLSDSIKASDCRIIHVCRDAKDVLVSRWFFPNRMKRSNDMEPIQSGRAFEMFCEGICPYGPIWDHVLEYWEESLRRPEKVLFMKYEEMLEEPIGNAKRLAEFMGCPFSLKEEKAGVVEEIVRLCSFEKLKNLEVNKANASIAPNIKLDHPTNSFRQRYLVAPSSYLLEQASCHQGN